MIFCVHNRKHFDLGPLYCLWNDWKNGELLLTDALISQVWTIINLIVAILFSSDFKAKCQIKCTSLFRWHLKKELVMELKATAGIVSVLTSMMSDVYFMATSVLCWRIKYVIQFQPSLILPKGGIGRPFHFSTWTFLYDS